MTYNKPNNITYVQMAMYFDEHIKDEERDDDKLFQYLYHLAYMLASKAKYFHLFEDYDQFAIYAATKIYLRAINQRTDSTAKPIKSILNYVKAVLYPMKVDYQKEAYDQIINPDIDDKIDGEKMKANMHANIQSEYQAGLIEETFEQLEQLPRYIKEVVEETPYKSDPLMLRRLQISVLISFLKGITISNAGLDKIKRREDRDLQVDDTFFKLLEKEKGTSATVWRLKDSMINYVDLLTNKVRKKFGENLIELRQSFLLKEEELDSIIMSAYSPSQRDNNEET